MQLPLYAAAERCTKQTLSPLPGISKAAAEDPNYEQHLYIYGLVGRSFVYERHWNGPKPAHRDDDSAHTESLMNKKDAIANEKISRAMNQLASTRKRLVALKKYEADYDVKANAQAAQACEELRRATCKTRTSISPSINN